MTIKTKDTRPDASSDTPVELPVASTNPPELGVADASAERDLESRVKVRRVELVARLRALRADTRLEATAAGDRLKARLSEVAHLIKESVVDGWTSLGDNAKHKLERWLAESARQLPAEKAPAQDVPAKD